MTEKATGVWNNIKTVASALSAVGGLVVAGIAVAAAIKEFKDGKNTTINVVYPKELFLPQDDPEKAPAISSDEPPEFVKVDEFEGHLENGVVVKN